MLKPSASHTRCARTTHTPRTRLLDGLETMQHLPADDIAACGLMAASQQNYASIMALESSEQRCRMCLPPLAHPRPSVSVDCACSCIVHALSPHPPPCRPIGALIPSLAPSLHASGHRRCRCTHTKPSLHEVIAAWYTRAKPSYTCQAIVGHRWPSSAIVSLRRYTYELRRRLRAQRCCPVRRWSLRRSSFWE